MVDSSTKKASGSTRKYENEATALPTVNSKRRIGAEAVEATDDGKQINLQQDEASPWVTPRSNCKNSLILEGDSKPKVDKRSRDRISDQLDNFKGPPPDQSIKFFPPDASFLPSKVTGERKSGVQKKNGEANQNTDAVEKHFSTLEQGIFTSDKVLPGDKTGSTANERSEILRMKLCELMGTIVSPSKDQTSSPPAKVGVTSFQPEPHVNQANDVIVQPKPNSDTIETDSEDPGCSKRRPVTRSKTRKKAQKTLPPKNIETSHMEGRKDKPKEGSTYLFEEGCRVIAGRSYKRSSSTLKRQNRIPTITTKSKETERKLTQIEPRKISFPSKDNEDMIQQQAIRNENSFSAGRSSPHGLRLKGSCSLSLHKVGNNARPSTVMTEKDPPEQMLERDLDGGKDMHISKLAEKIVCGNHKGNMSSLGNSADQLEDFISPTLGRTPVMSSAPSSSCKDGQAKQEAGKPSVVEAMCNLERMFTFGNFTSKEVHAQRREQRDLRNDEREPQGSISDSDSSEFSSGGRDLDISGKDLVEEETFSPEVVTIKKPEFMLHRPKRFRVLRGTKSYGHEPVSRSSKGKGTRTTTRIEDSGEFHVQDEFTRAIGPLALSLEKIKSKVKSVTANKSSEILNSLAVKIQTQMRSVESQVQSDMGRLKSFSKQKRKFLEREFQEQEQQLKLIYERFKKEISQHLQRCIETNEGLDENKIELKKILEKQKASHRKLLMQVEQAAQTEIQDAEKRISDMNKVAREQMLQLKLLIEQYLGEGVLC